MKGKHLNGIRNGFLQAMASLLEDAQSAMSNAKGNPHRFDAYSEYHDEFARDYMAKIADAQLAMMKLIELLDA